LIDRFIHHPDVIGIDIGYAPDLGEETNKLVLRIHVRERWIEASPDKRVAFPEQVEGIPVVVMSGDIPHLEARSSPPG